MCAYVCVRECVCACVLQPRASAPALTPDTPDDLPAARPRLLDYQVLFPPIQNASIIARRHELPREALYAHGHGVRRAKTRHVDEEDYVCFRSPALAALSRGQVCVCVYVCVCVCVCT